jgi:hypothetical protein
MMRSTTRNTWLLALLVIGASAGIASAAEPADAADSAEKLLRERLEVLEEIARLEEAAYGEGSRGFDRVATARMEVLSAKLELAKMRDERIAIREEFATIARQYEAAAEAGFKASIISRPEYLKAKAFRLRAEADLARERSAEASQAEK